MTNLTKTKDFKDLIDSYIKKNKLIPITLIRYKTSYSTENQALAHLNYDDKTFKVGSYTSCDYYIGLNQDNKYISSYKYLVLNNIRTDSNNLPFGKLKSVLKYLMDSGVWFKLKLAYEFSRDLDWTPGLFGDSGSCYFGGKAGARKMILDNGGFAIKIYDNSKSNPRNYPVGRMWGAFVKNAMYVWNGYTTRSSSIQSFIPNYSYHYVFSLGLAKHFGLYMSAIDLYNNGTTSSTLHINNGGIRISPTNSSIHRLDLNWKNAELYRCCSCAFRSYNRDDFEFSNDSYTACLKCAEKVFDICNFDLNTYHISNMIYGPDNLRYYNINISIMDKFVRIYDNSYQFRDNCKALKKRNGENVWIPKNFKRKLCPYCEEIMQDTKKICDNCKLKQEQEKKLSSKFKKTIKFYKDGTIL